MSKVQDGVQEHYHYLVAHPGSWRQQLWLRDRHMTVGQLIAAMRANGMNAVEAAADFDLPLAQIEEAVAYYQQHRDLVDAELRAEKEYLREKGYPVEPSSLPR